MNPFARQVFTEGDSLPFLNTGTAIAWGDVIDLDTRIAVAGANIGVGETGTMITEGVFELPAVTTAAFTVGEELYWDAANKVLTNIGEGLTPAGWCVAPKLQAAALAQVKLKSC